MSTPTNTVPTHSRRFRVACSVAAVAITVAIIAAVVVVGILSTRPSTAAPAALDRSVQAMRSCIATMTHIAAVNQPENADAWADLSDDLCTRMLDSMGEEDFNDTFLDEVAVQMLINEETGGKG